MSGGVKGDVIHSYIVAAGDPGVRAMIQGTIGTDWSLSLCLGHPAFAAVSYRTGNQVETVVFGDRTSTGRSQRLITLPFRAILICGELWEDTLKRRNAALAGAALTSHSAAHATKPLLNKVDSIARVSAGATLYPPRGVHDHGSRQSAAGAAGTAAP